MIKKLVICLLCMIGLPVLESDAGLILRQGRGLFPQARGVVGRVCTRKQRRVARRAYRRSAYGYCGYSVQVESTTIQ